ncbi:hypothetical protein ON010_g231 [Phytophthora cinnamomi]|nr:hypothetical protein ON010_g231 [Phytophthora cinnamomi]
MVSRRAIELTRDCSQQLATSAAVPFMPSRDHERSHLHRFSAASPQRSFPFILRSPARRIALIGSSSRGDKMETPTKPTVGLDSSDALMAHGPTVLHSFVADKLEAAMGKAMPQMEVRFKDLSISAKVFASRHADPKAQLPTLYNSVKKAATSINKDKYTAEKTILKNASGVFKPGTITLLLGQPGSGKSSLMKVLSGRFPLEKNVTIDGEITYNGVPQADIMKRLPQFAAYVTQRDKHFPTLTVKETLEFAHAFCGGGISKRGEKLLSRGTPEATAEALDAIKALYAHYPEVVMKQLGLENCKDTIVGNGMLRGVSGGERKRVTTGEMEFGMKYMTLMDEISTGLDSAATYDIINTQRGIAKTLLKTVVIALLQPAPEVFALFDDVMIMNEGESGLRVSARPRRCRLLAGPGHRRAVQVRGRAAARHGTLPAARERVRRHLPRVRHLHRHDAGAARTAPPGAAHGRRHSYGHDARVPPVVLGEHAHSHEAADHGHDAQPSVHPGTHHHGHRHGADLLEHVLASGPDGRAGGHGHHVPGDPVPGAGPGLTGADVHGVARRVLQAAWGQLLPHVGVRAGMLGGAGAVGARGEYRVWKHGVLDVRVHGDGGGLYLLPDPAGADEPGVRGVVLLADSRVSGFPHRQTGLDIQHCLLHPVRWLRDDEEHNAWLYRADEFDVCVYDGLDYCAQFNKKMGEYYLEQYDVPSAKMWVWSGIVFMMLCYAAFMGLGCLVLEYKRYESPEHTIVKKTEDDSEMEVETAYALVKTPRNSAYANATTTLDAIALDVDTQREKNFTPVTIAFQDLWYSVPHPKNPKESLDLLKGISGFAKPGTMTALMGSSGAGKTTLMDVIAGRKTGGTIKGKILFNGYEATDLAIRRCTGYCEQMDIHSDATTIREAFAFSAFLRQDSSIPDNKKYDTVNECLDLLGMNGIADQIVRGSSVEQMKRLTIGVELAAQPSVLFLDEPTSGLDARSAKVIMDGVRKVADTGRTVVCTIHQPSSDVFYLFDHLLLLKRGGETVFVGELGEKCYKLVEYFEAIPGVAPLPERYNPATWMLECIGAGVGKVVTNQTDFVQYFKESKEKRVLDAEMAEEGVAVPSSSLPEMIFQKKRAASSWTQAKFLTMRFMRMYWRTPTYNMTRFVIGLFLALLFGLTYVDVEYVSYQGINGGVGMVFMTTLFNGIVSFNGVLPIASGERGAYYRERASQTYNSLWYFVGSTIAEIPVPVALHDHPAEIPHGDPHRVGFLRLPDRADLEQHAGRVRERGLGARMPAGDEPAGDHRPYHRQGLRRVGLRDEARRHLEQLRLLSPVHRCAAAPGAALAALHQPPEEISGIHVLTNVKLTRRTPSASLLGLQRRAQVTPWPKDPAQSSHGAAPARPPAAERARRRRREARDQALHGADAAAVAVAGRGDQHVPPAADPQGPHRRLPLRGGRGGAGRGRERGARALVRRLPAPPRVRLHAQAEFYFPYAFMTVEGEDEWVANVHIINTRSMTPRRAHRCLECPCTAEDVFTADAVNGIRFRNGSCNAQLRFEKNTVCSAETYHGGLRCCEDAEFCLEHDELEVAAASNAKYQLRYSLEYAEIVPENRPLYLAACCDASGDLEHMGNIEYDVPVCDPETHPGCVHTLSTRQRLDNGSIPLFAYRQNPPEPEREVELVYAVGHQHRGGLGIQLYDDATGDLLCASVPEYGSGTEAGNEDGYVISMSTCTFDPPRRMRTTDIVRIVALYNNTLPHTGVMSLMYMALSDFPLEEAATAVVKTTDTTATTTVSTVSSGGDNWAFLGLGTVAGAAACVLVMAALKRWKQRSGYTPLQPRAS